MEPHLVTVLHMFALAVRSYPDATWDQLVRYTCDMGAGRTPRIRRAEVQALGDMTLRQITDAINAQAPS